MDPRLLRLYESELRFMRDMGSEFAAEYPKIAQRLGLGTTEVADPYVERLLEGFAFLTARVQMKMEAEFPTFTQSLLQMVYPHYLAPTPSMAVVRFQPDAGIRATPDGVILPAGTELRSVLGTEDQTNCEFRTAHKVHLLPIELVDADYIGSSAAVLALGVPERRGVKAAIRLRLRVVGDATFDKLALDTLTFYLGGSDGTRMRLYEQLVCNVVQVFARPAKRPMPWQESLPASVVRPIGFEPDEALLPLTAQSFDGYRLLQEYFAMPERFLFIAIDGLDRAAIRNPTGELEIILLLDGADPVLASGFDAASMLLFCTPAINLFPRRADRINMADREVESAIVPDRMRPLDFEVFDVRGVEGYRTDGTPPQRFLPFYAAHDLSRNVDQNCFYTLRREARQMSARARQRGPRSSYLGHDVLITLVDGNEAPVSSELRQLGVDLLCTNRDLPLSMPIGKQATDFTIMVSAPVASVRCVAGPTPPRPCRGGGDYAWRFISHLNLNYLTLVNTDQVQGAAALRELLRLYLPENAAVAARSLEGVLSVASSSVVRRIPGSGPMAAGRGLGLTLTIDETPFGGSGAVLLASVLEKFFAKYVSINGFTETTLRCVDRGEVMRWPLRLGGRAIL